jgi:hypothetical protein
VVQRIMRFERLPPHSTPRSASQMTRLGAFNDAFRAFACEKCQEIPSCDKSQNVTAHRSGLPGAPRRVVRLCRVPAGHRGLLRGAFEAVQLVWTSCM